MAGLDLRHPPPRAQGRAPEPGQRRPLQQAPGDVAVYGGLDLRTPYAGVEGPRLGARKVVAGDEADGNAGEAGERRVHASAAAGLRGRLTVVADRGAVESVA